MSKNIILKIISPIPLIIMLMMIFNFSGQNGEESGSLSLNVGLFLVKLFTGEADMEKAEAIQFLIRKTAHVTEFMVLTFSAYWPLCAWHIRESHFPGRVIIAGAVAVACAAFDEMHQLFVEGRSGSARDVLIDSIGVVIAAAVIVGIHAIINRPKKLKD